MTMKTWGRAKGLIGTLLVLLALGACSQGESVAQADSAPAVASASGLPRLLDLGADQCIPCKMMEPILAELEKTYAGRFEVKFIDVWKKREEAAIYGVQMIPTQIFYAADGKELFRHTGFYSREEILARWQELGYRFGEQNR